MTPTTPAIDAPHSPPGGGRVRLFVFAFLALHAFYYVAYFVNLFQNGYTEGVDWHFLWIVARHFVEGDWAHLYAMGDDSLVPRMFWLYPPFALYVIAPLALFPDLVAYGVMAGTGTASLVGAMFLLRRMAPLRGYDLEWALAVLFSYPALATLVTGQNSALLTLLVAAAAALRSRDRVVLAACVLGLFAMKPNWGLFFGLFALVRGEWKAAFVMVGVVASLCLTTLPLGFGLWQDYLSMMLRSESFLAAHTPKNMLMLRGFLAALFGHGALMKALWLCSASGLFLAAATIWRRVDQPIHLLGSVLLLIIAANPYVNFYDGLVLAIPATVWWSSRTWWSPSGWRIVGGLIAAAWMWEYIPTTVGLLVGVGSADTPFSIVGPCVALWLLIEAFEVRFGRLAEWRPGHAGA